MEYHLFPGHDYWPEGYYQNRRDGFSSLLVYDSDYDRVLKNGSQKGASMELYVPSCRGEAVTSCSNKDEGAWRMTYIRGRVEREVR